jgi:hypothetical protein
MSFLTCVKSDILRRHNRGSAPGEVRPVRFLDRLGAVRWHPPSCRHGVLRSHPHNARRTMATPSGGHAAITCPTRPTAPASHVPAVLQTPSSSFVPPPHGTCVPNSRPTPADAAMANAPQHVIRNAPRRTGAPPTRAATGMPYRTSHRCEDRCARAGPSWVPTASGHWRRRYPARGALSRRTGATYLSAAPTPPADDVSRASPAHHDPS